MQEFVRRGVQCGMRYSSVGTVWVREGRGERESGVAMGSGRRWCGVENDWSLGGERRGWREIRITYLGFHCAGTWLLGEREGSFGQGSY